MLELTGGVNEGRFPLVTFSNVDQVVRAPQVLLGENPSGAQLFQSGGNQRHWLSLLAGDGVQSPVVDAGSGTPVFLLHKEESYGDKGSGQMDDTLVSTSLTYVCMASSLGERGHTSIPWPRVVPPLDR